MFHGEGEVFGEGVEESEVGFCMVFIPESPHPSSTKWE